MWVARDSYGVVTLFENYPTRIKDGWFAEGDSMLIYPDSFPNLKWEDDPLEIKLVPKHNNDEEIIEDFSKALLKDMRSMDEDFSKVINDNFWKLV